MRLHWKEDWKLTKRGERGQQIKTRWQLYDWHYACVRACVCVSLRSLPEGADLLITGVSHMVVHTEAWLF